MNMILRALILTRRQFNIHLNHIFFRWFCVTGVMRSPTVEEEVLASSRSDCQLIKRPRIGSNIYQTLYISLLYLYNVTSNTIITVL